MKIRLIEPEPPGMHVWAKVLLPRLGLPIIAATLKEHGHDVLIYNPQMAPIDWDDVNSADLVGLSSTTSTATTAYEFADDLRARGIPVVIGGSHVTFMADEALEHADYVARGEGGEQLMLELIEALDGRARAGHHRRPLVHARRGRRAQRAARAAAPTSTRCRSRTCACSSATRSSRPRRS